MPKFVLLVLLGLAACAASDATQPSEIEGWRNVAGKRPTRAEYAAVVAAWSWTLVRAAGAVLLDMSPDAVLPQKISERLERNGDRICDLHVWRVGPGHVSAIVTLVSDRPELPSVYKSKLADLPHLSHVTIEVERCPGTA